MISRPRIATGIVAVIMAAALSACGGPTTPAKPTVEVPPANPLTVDATFDTARTQQTWVPLTGGTLSTTDADGTVYTLTIPDGALLEATEVSLTPQLSLTGAPVSGRAHGVLLEPSGLRLYQPATLEVAPSDGETFSAIGFAAAAGGGDFHLVPPLLGGDGTTVEFQLHHFSEHGAFTGSEVDPIIILDPPSEFMPVDWESQLAQMMAKLIKAEREALLRGEEGDPDFEKKVEAIMNTFYVKVIAPMLPKIASDCSYAEANNAKVLGWVRSTLLWGMEETFAGEGQAVWDAVIAGAHNCWEEAIQPCVDPSAPSFARVVQTARMNQLLGGSEEVYDPMREDIRCDGTCAWLEDVDSLTLAASFAWNQSGSDEFGTGTVDRSWTAAATLPEVPSYGTFVKFSASTLSGGGISANFNVDDDYSGDGGESNTSGSGTPHRVDLTITFDTSTCTYEADFHLEVDVVTVDDGVRREHTLTIGSVELYNQGVSAAGISGSLAVPHTNDVAAGESSFWTGWDDGAHVLIQSGLGAAEVGWTIAFDTATH